MPRKEPKVFPNIPRYEDEPSLQGAPGTPEESIFLSQPALALVADMAIRLKAVKSEERRRLIEKLAEEALDDPPRLIASLDAIAFFNETKGYDIAYFKEKLDECIDRKLNHGQFKHFPPSTDALYAWLELGAESDLYRPLAEKALKKIIERCADPASLTDVIYELANAGLTSQNQRVAEKTIQIIAYQSDILPVGSRQGNDLFLANFDLDDSTLKKAMEVDSAFVFLCAILGLDFFEKKKTAISRIVEKRDVKESLKKIQATNPGRFRKLASFYDRSVDAYGVAEMKGGKAFMGADIDSFPLSIIYRNAGPLRRWLNEQLAEKLGSTGDEKAVSLRLPLGEGVHAFDEGMVEFIKRELNKENDSGIGFFEEEGYWKTLTYLAPGALGGAEKRKSLERINNEMRQDMRDNTRYLLSPRGDLIEIADDALRELGFSSVLYRMDRRNKRDTIVTIEIGKYFFRILLDEYFLFRDLETRKPVDLSNGPFLQNIILSHLREIRCSEKVDEIGASTEKGVGSRKTFTSRRPHRRILPEGQSPTSEQIEKVLRDYDVDLIRMNREMQARGEVSKITFVSEVEAAMVGNMGPVRSEAPYATHKLREIMAA